MCDACETMRTALVAFVERNGLHGTIMQRTGDVPVFRPDGWPCEIVVAAGSYDIWRDGGEPYVFGVTEARVVELLREGAP